MANIKQTEYDPTPNIADGQDAEEYKEFMSTCHCRKCGNELICEMIHNQSELHNNNDYLCGFCI